MLPVVLDAPPSPRRTMHRLHTREKMAQGKVISSLPPRRHRQRQAAASALNEGLCILGIKVLFCAGRTAGPKGPCG
ncbi:hypothetical protein PsYK624_076210 [Phanerochaete sordida]|uniref:Uncharacterized protein n=1 Tax=Phanerochaete sordida TaxID=48140 RepID=A0A9P3GB04_9APHY|nr:hypothetical protein PsYK624_076210 [Phanerochaete sordida]